MIKHFMHHSESMKIAKTFSLQHELLTRIASLLEHVYCMPIGSYSASMPSRRTKKRVNYNDWDPSMGSPPPHNFEDGDDEDFDVSEVVQEPSDDEMDVVEDADEESQSIEELGGSQVSGSNVMQSIPANLPKRGRPKQKKPLADPLDKHHSSGDADLEFMLQKPVPLQLPERPRSPQPDRYSQKAGRERWEAIFGTNNDDLVKAVEYRLRWASYPFVPYQEVVDLPPEYSKTGLYEPQSGTPCGLKCAKTSADAVLSGSDLILQDDQLVKLAPGESRVDQDVIHLNTGYAASDARWAPFHDGTQQFLAIGLLSDSAENPMDAKTSRETIGVFKDPTCASILTIYKIDISDNPEAAVWCTIDCGIHGPIMKIRWRPVKDSTDAAIICQDGTCMVVNVPVEKGSYKLADTVSWSPTECHATACSWMSPSNLVVGMSDGFVGEYDTTKGFAPLYLIPIHSSVINEVVTAFPNNTKQFFSTSVDGSTVVVETEYFTQNISLKGRYYFVPCAFSSLTNSFLTLEDEFLTKMVPAFTPGLVGGVLLTCHDAKVNAVAATTNHPFMLVGCTDGSVVLCNVLRRTGIVKKTPVPEKEIRLWTLQCAENKGTYRVVEQNLVSDQVTKTAKKANALLQLFPSGCCITSLDWLQSRHHASWFAATTGSGLVRVQNLH